MSQRPISSGTYFKDPAGAINAQLNDILLLDCQLLLPAFSSANLARKAGIQGEMHWCLQMEEQVLLRQIAAIRSQLPADSELLQNEPQRLKDALAWLENIPSLQNESPGNEQRQGLQGQPLALHGMTICHLFAHARNLAGTPSLLPFQT